MNIVPYLLDFLSLHASYAHWAIFFLLILAGFNLPISEDLLLIVSGFLASVIIPENTYKLFIFTFLGAYLSDWIAYGMGAFLGRKIWQWQWSKNLIQKKYFIQLKVFYKRYGMATLFWGRFIPFGVRNCLFITAGMIRMPFLRFILIDGLACLSSNSMLFSISYYCGKNHQLLDYYIQQYRYGILILVAFSFLFLFRKIFFKQSKEV